MFGDFCYNNRKIEIEDISSLKNGTPIVRYSESQLPFYQFAILDGADVIYQLFQYGTNIYNYVRVPISEFTKDCNAEYFEYVPQIFEYNPELSLKRATSMVGTPAKIGLPSVFGDDFTFWCLVGEKFWDYFVNSKVGGHYKHKYKEGIFSLYHHAIAIEQDVVIHYTDLLGKKVRPNIYATPFSNLEHPKYVEYVKDSFRARWATRNRAIYYYSCRNYLKPYDIRKNNCEHFASLCRTGKRSSDQVKSGYVDLGLIALSFIVPQAAPFTALRLLKYFS